MNATPATRNIPSIRRHRTIPREGALFRLVVCLARSGGIVDRSQTGAPEHFIGPR